MSKTQRYSDIGKSITQKLPGLDQASHCEHNQNMCAQWATEKELARLIGERASKGRNVTLTPDTAETVARRLMKSHDPDPHLKSLTFRLEVWDASGSTLIELLAASSTFALIKLGYEAALATRRNDRLFVRQGIRVVLDSGSPDPDGAANVVRLR